MKKFFSLVSAMISFFSISGVKAQSEVTFYTSMGTFVSETYDTLQPITAGNFLTLVGDEFYDGIIFHRVIDSFMIQGGDPLGTGFGGPGYTIPDEFDPNTSNIQRAISMANAGPNTGGSQFFINLVNNLYLNPNYPVFGIVTSNFSVVQAIGQVPVNVSDRPLTPVVMDSVRITNPMTSMDYFSGAQPLIEIYPNPVTENSRFTIRTKSAGKGSIAIYDQMGNAIFQKEIQLNGDILDVDPLEIRSLNLSSGIYYFMITDGKSFSLKKFVAG